MLISSQCSRFFGKFAHWRIRNLRRPSAGFTLIELLVVITVVLVLTSLLLIRQQKFNSSTLLRSLAYSVAISVRQAQLYGTAVRESASGAFNGGTAAQGYGIYFSSGSTGSYILFADLNNNAQYDSGESVQVFTLNGGYTISKFCGTNTSGTERCWTPTSSGITTLSLLFKRPNPDACFATSFSTNACQTGVTPTESYSKAYVQIKSGNDTRSVTVTVTGQISVGAQGS